MRLMRMVAGGLLGVALVFAGSTSSASAIESPICDITLLGPVVCGVGDGLEDVLTPATPTQPAPQAPAPAPEPQAPVQPAPADPAQPGWVDPGTSSNSGNSPAMPSEGVTLEPVTPTPTPTPSPEPTINEVVQDYDRDGEQDAHPFRLSPLTPFFLGTAVVLLLAISISAFGSYFARRRK